MTCVTGFRTKIEMALPVQMAAPISSLPSSPFCVQVSVQLHFLTPDSCV